MSPSKAAWVTSAASSGANRPPPPDPPTTTIRSAPPVFADRMARRMDSTESRTGCEQTTLHRGKCRRMIVRIAGPFVSSTTPLTISSPVGMMLAFVGR